MMLLMGNRSRGTAHGDKGQKESRMTPRFLAFATARW